MVVINHVPHTKGALGVALLLKLNLFLRWPRPFECVSSAESASPQGRILAHTCGESKYFAGSRGVGAQLQLIYGFADYFAAASCVRLPSSLTRTCTNKAHAAALCSASVRFKRGNTFWPQKAAAALTRLPD